MHNNGNHSNQLLFQQEKPSLFADVIVPIYLPKILTWSIPAEWNNRVQQGSRVIVQIGKSKRYAGIIKRLHTDVPGLYETKPILEVLDFL